MTDWSVYARLSVAGIHRPRYGVNDPELDRVLEVLADILGPFEPSLTLGDDEISVQAWNEADDANTAATDVVTAVGAACEAVGKLTRGLLELHVRPWTEFENDTNSSLVPELWSSVEVAEHLHVSRQRVHQLVRENPRFPQPFLRLGTGPLWLATTIRTFLRQWDRRPGRPRLAPGNEPITKTG